VRVRVALGIALVLVAGVFVLELSGRSPRIAASDHTNPQGFVATVPSGGMLCQPVMTLPADAASVEVLIGTFGHPVPRMTASFEDPGHQSIRPGRIAAGAREGYVQIPLGYPHGAAVGGTLCLHLGETVHPVVFAGDVFGAGNMSEQVNGVPQAGRIDVVYLRPGRESWWQLLGTLDERFGFGKASFFGDWTLPVAALLLLGVWIATLRLLGRELT
jgi:hypothetical protein